MSIHEAEEAQHLATLDELEATQEQIHNYQGLLKELPEIFERKFNERLKPLLDRQQQLLDERQHQLQQLLDTVPSGSPPDKSLLGPSSSSSSSLNPPRSIPSRNWRKASWWLLALAGMGVTFGVLLSKQLPPPGSKQTSTLRHPVAPIPLGPRQLPHA